MRQLLHSRVLYSLVCKCGGDVDSKLCFDFVSIEIQIWELYSTWAGEDNSWFSPAPPKESHKLSAAGTQSPKFCRAL